ncbi:Leucine-rich repeat extensin-like protein 6 [Sesamum angolense]|uniref:Leucine-rich repeat extensin-like protein 6 n=1 Tax=Sesamum angolense TaxID=2727404 RepID=A0AAE1VZQ0_9LAMI|nr:Leucine-rich repeat extensin-like protein 6 [Sesamum angolense]
MEVLICMILLLSLDVKSTLVKSQRPLMVIAGRGAAAAVSVQVTLPPVASPLQNQLIFADQSLFHANSNNFSGTIPGNIVKLPYLYELDISNNRFSGPFPTAILAMDGLSFLDIRYNFFSGSVPPELFAKDLDALFLNNNNFMTRLPDDIGATHVEYLTLANNKFFGPIPRGIAKALSGLSEILLLDNMLSGCLPYELGLLKEAVVFDAGNNNLTGPLPFSLGCLEKLEVLNFAGNLLYGSIPDVLCGLTNLMNLSLSDNYLTQAGPSCMRLIKNGVLDVRKNCIPGRPFQRSVAECAAFFARPRNCPYMDTYSKVPCWLPNSVLQLLNWLLHLLNHSLEMIVVEFQLLNYK